jgi:hypothetical protein
MCVRGGIVREGALTHQSLVDAVATERAAGRVPQQLAVADEGLWHAALAILAPSDGLDDLRGAIPNVLVDVELPAGSWELREA